MKTLINILLVAATATTAAIEETITSNYTFAVIPKQTNSSFFSVVQEGCLAQAAILDQTTNQTVNCLYVGPEDNDPAAQADYIDAMINGTYGKIDGISVSVSDDTIISAAIDRADNAGIPVITFDSDAKNSKRQAYVGTNNTAFGIELGKVLNQLAPGGGTYGIMAAEAPNVLERVAGVRARLADTKWVEIEGGYKDCEDSAARAIEIMPEFANENVNAIVPVGGWPMLGDKDKWKDFVDANRHMTLVVGDTLPQQLDLVNQGYVNGLVGQLPFNMGQMSIGILMDICNGKPPANEQVFGTALLEVMQFPLILPEIEVNYNYLGNLAIMGYVLFTVIAVATLVLSVWTHLNRKKRVIKASQPFFLQMILIGVFIFGSNMINLSFDPDKHSQKTMDASCMASPWLLTIGFTTMFSAMYAKLWRINRIFHHPNAFTRIKVTERDVLKPYFVLLGMNVVTLSCWTALAPVTYQRRNNDGTDDWNRVISTYGVCTSYSEENSRPANSFIPYLVIIVIINLGLLIIANIQAYRARSIQTEYSESKYIALIMASMLQAFALGVPCIFLLWEEPQAYFVVTTLVIFSICGVVLGFMFWPKYFHHRMWKIEKAEKERKRKSARAKIMGAPAGTTLNSKGDSVQQNSEGAGDNGLKIAVRPDPTFKSTLPNPSTVQSNKNLSKDAGISTVSLVIDDLESDGQSSQSSDDEAGLKVSIMSTPGFRNSSYWLNANMIRQSNVEPNERDQISESDQEGLMVSMPNFSKPGKTKTRKLKSSTSLSNHNNRMQSTTEEDEFVKNDYNSGKGQTKGRRSKRLTNEDGDGIETLDEAKEEIKKLRTQLLEYEHLEAR